MHPITAGILLQKAVIKPHNGTVKRQVSVILQHVNVAKVKSLISNIRILGLRVFKALFTTILK